MRRLALGLVGTLLVGVLILSVGIFAAPFPALPTTKAAPRGASVAGIFHVHAEGSHDGFGTLNEAIDAARGLGVQFLVLTEHEELRPQSPRRERGLLVVPAAELSAQAGHVIALGPVRLPPERDGRVLAAIEREGGLALLAHPINLRRPWTDPSPDGFAGIEVLSLDSAFRQALSAPSLRVFLSALALAVDARKAGALLVERPREAFARYDAIASRRPLALLCGVDAHGLPAYATSFAALHLHVELTPDALTRWGDDPRKDAAALREGILQARTFCSVPALGDASGFSFGVSDGRLRIVSPNPEASIVVLRDGRELHRQKGAVWERAVAPGSYRAELYVDAGFPFGAGRLWIATSARTIGPASTSTP